MLPQELIRKKRDGLVLSDNEVRDFIVGVTKGSIPDYQVAAMLMAITLRGMGPSEIAALADAMVHSGDVLDLSGIPLPKIDKHSTGGVGDKISIPLAPAVACCGVAVPMVSGRGLGHTGGTLDKLESIPGFRVDLSVEHFIKQTADLGTCLIGQTEQIAPADRYLYAMRDVTGTVESVPLIASSIMSKKLAEGIDGLVLDCKVGKGAFMTDEAGAMELAAAIQTIGHSAGKQIAVVLTRMDAPIGLSIGNALEIEESIATLRGGGPADTRELTVALGAEMLRLGGVCDDDNVAAKHIETVLDNGEALMRFQRVIEAQGGDPSVVDDPNRLPKASQSTVVCAHQDGYISGIDARQIGIANVVLGGGRTRKEDSIDPSVGIRLEAQIGDSVSTGTPLAQLLHNHRGVDAAQQLIQTAYTIGEREPDKQSRIIRALR